MCNLPNYFDVHYIVVVGVLRSVTSNCIHYCFFQLGGNAVLAEISVRDVSALQTLGKISPRVDRDVVVLACIKSPNMTSLQHLYQLLHLFVPTTVVKVLDVQRLALGVVHQRLEHCINHSGRGIRWDVIV